MGENNWLLVKFQVKDPKSAPGAQVFALSKNGDGMKKDKDKDKRMIDCPGCGAALSIDEEEDNVWFDTGDEVVLVPREMLKYLEDSQGVLGIT